MGNLSKRWAGLVAGIILGAGVAGGISIATATPGQFAASYPNLQIAAGDCVIGAVTAVYTAPCAWGALSGPQFNAAMMWLAESQNQMISKMAAGVQAGQNKIIAGMGKLADAQVARRNQTVRNQTKANTAIALKRVYDQLAGGINNVCSSVTVPQAIQAAGQSTDVWRGKTETGLRQWRTGFPTSFAAIDGLSALAQRGAALSTDNIYGSTNPNDTAAYIALLALGPPMVYIDPEEMPASARKSYRADQAKWGAKANLATGALKYIATMNARTIPASKIARQYGQMGEPVPSGNISKREMERVMSSWRANSQSWPATVGGYDMAGLAREQLLMQATRMKIEYERLANSDRILALLAAQYGADVAGEKPNPARTQLSATTPGEGNQ